MHQTWAETDERASVCSLKDERDANLWKIGKTMYSLDTAAKPMKLDLKELHS